MRKFSSGFVAFCLLLLLLFVGGAFAFGRSAPLSPEFLRYREELTRKGERRPGLKGAGPEKDRPLGYVPSPVDLSHLAGADYSRFMKKNRFADKGSLPVAYDLRNEGRVTPVKDQNPYGACWSFAAIAAAESSYLTQFGGDPNDPNLNLSELHLAWFAYEEENKGFKKLPRDILNQGGTNTKATATLARWTGLVAENDLPYEEPFSPDKTASEYPNSLHLRDAFYLYGWSQPDSVPERLGNDAWKRLIMENGGLSIAYSHYKKFYSPGEKSFYNPKGEVGDGHQVLVVGWNDNYSKNNFNSSDLIPPPKNDGAWLAKNSWGTDWGEQGYFWISYEEWSLKEGAVFRVASADKMYDHNYGYDDLGWCETRGVDGVEKNKGWMGNVFTAGSDETLKAVSFYTTAANASFELRVYKGEGAAPLFSNLVSGQDGVFPFAGYHTVDLDVPVSLSKGEKFSVVLKMTTPGYDYPLAIEKNIAWYSENAVCNPGESYFSSDGDTWLDGAYEVGEYNLPDPVNACIKAFTLKAPELGEAIESAYFEPGKPYRGTVRLANIKGVNVTNADVTPANPAVWSALPSVTLSPNNVFVVAGTVNGNSDVLNTDLNLVVSVDLGGGVLKALKRGYTLMKKLPFEMPLTPNPSSAKGGAPYVGRLTVSGLAYSEVASVNVVPSSPESWSDLNASFIVSTNPDDTDVTIKGTPLPGFTSSKLMVKVALRDGRFATETYTLTETLPTPPEPEPTPTPKAPAVPTRAEGWAIRREAPDAEGNSLVTLTTTVTLYGEPKSLSVDTAGFVADSLRYGLYREAVQGLSVAEEGQSEGHFYELRVTGKVAKAALNSAAITAVKINGHNADIPSGGLKLAEMKPESPIPPSPKGKPVGGGGCNTGTSTIAVFAILALALCRKKD